MTSHNRTATFRVVLGKLVGDSAWGLIIAIAFLLVSNILTVVYIWSLQGNLQTMFEKDLLGQNYVQTARIKLLTISNGMNSLFHLEDPKEKSDAVDAILSQKTELDFYLKKSVSRGRSSKATGIAAEIDKAFGECRTVIDTLIQMSKSDISEGAFAIILGDMKNRFEAFDRLLYKLDNIKLKHDIKIYRNIDYQLTISIVFTLVTLLITIGYKLFVFRRTKAGRVPARQAVQAAPADLFSKAGK